MSLWSRIANVFRGERINREIEEEIESHLAEAVEEGRDPEEARRALGASLHHREDSHEIRVVGWLDSLRADFIFGWRQLKRNKVTSAAAGLSLALAIGACTSAFRLIDALLLRPLPVAHPERLYATYRQGMGFDNRPGSWDSWAYPDFQLMRDAAKGQAQLIAVSYADRTDLTFKTDEDMEKATLQYVSGSMFDAFELRPTLGRLLSDSDDREPRTHPYAVISYDYWSRRFARDPRVVGQTFHLGDDVLEIVGVGPRSFTGTEPGTVVDVFLPTMMESGVTRQDRTWIRTLVVVEPGVQLEPLRQKLGAVSHAFEANRLQGETGLSPETLHNVLQQEFRMEASRTGSSELQREYRQALGALGVLVLLVLFIACMNVANLMTARAAARAREMALRVSIGAGRWRLIQMVLAESAVLGLLAAAAGGIFAWWAAPFIVGMINPPNNPARLILDADWRVLAFGLALTIGVVLLFGLLPALRASSVKPVSALRGGDDPHSRRRTMYAMIAAQVAFCFVVLFVSGLFVATFERLSHQPTGFSSERLLLLESTTRPPQSAVYWDRVAERLRAVPGVERVSQAGWPLLKGVGWNDSISFHGGPPSTELAYFLNVSPGWLETMSIPLLSGRDLRDADSYPDVAIVNQTFAREFLHTDNPVGMPFEKASDDGSREHMLVVGLAKDAAYRSIGDPMIPVVFVPLHHRLPDGTLRPLLDGTFIVRTASSDPMSMAADLRRQVVQARSAFHVSNARTQQEVNEAQTVRERLLAMLAYFFGAVALLLSGVGLYGVLNYSLLQQQRELGIRIALGARAASIVRQLVRSMIFALGGGLVSGLILGFVSSRFIESLLYHARPTDPAFLAIPCALIAVAALIAATPAVLRAVRIDPAAMLRSE